LKKRKDFNSWKDAIQECNIGTPRVYPYYWASSGNLIHNAYCLTQAIDKTNVSITKLQTVFEFGGGYGSMCRLLLQRGFTGVYIIFDLPEFLLLQQYFLESTFGDRIDISFTTSLDKHRTDRPLVILISDVNQLKKMLASSGKSIDLFIATWSLSEAPCDVRAEVFSAMDVSIYFIAYRDIFEHINNTQYFKQFRRDSLQYKWHDNEIPYLPGNYILCGKKI